MTGPIAPVEATGPEGAQIFYVVSVSDREDGPGLGAVCKPAPGSVFPLGTTTARCVATDSAGRSSGASLALTVRDTSAPVLSVPKDVTVRSAEPVVATANLIHQWLTSALASDLVDTSLTIATDAPAAFPLGATAVTFSVADASGNRTLKTRTITVSPSSGLDPDWALPPKYQASPLPGNVRDLQVTLGDRSVSLRWVNPDDTTFAAVIVTRSPGRSGAKTSDLYQGDGTALVDRSLQAGRQYRYLLVTRDDEGNTSAGIAVVVAAKSERLRAPPDGALVRRAPRLVWKPVRRASYYNVQLFRVPRRHGETVDARGRKVLSAWPKTSSLRLHSTWRYAGHTYHLAPGGYAWYVWPGFGRKGAARYGALLGERAFRVAARR